MLRGGLAAFQLGMVTTIDLGQHTRAEALVGDLTRRDRNRGFRVWPYPAALLLCDASIGSGNSLIGSDNSLIW